tara:strand:+ start:438 stop:542 length:105 start_codon:yes stop_codon:yes gene_type:complete
MLSRTSPVFLPESFTPSAETNLFLQSDAFIGLFA